MIGVTSSSSSSRHCYRFVHVKGARVVQNFGTIILSDVVMGGWSVAPLYRRNRATTAIRIRCFSTSIIWAPFTITSLSSSSGKSITWMMPFVHSTSGRCTWIQRLLNRIEYPVGDRAGRQREGKAKTGKHEINVQINKMQCVWHSCAWYLCWSASTASGGRDETRTRSRMPCTGIIN